MRSLAISAMLAFCLRVAFAADTKRQGRVEAIRVIGALGIKAAAAIPLLEEAVEDKDPGIAVAAREALAKIRP